MTHNEILSEVEVRFSSFRKHFSVIVLEVLYVHGADVFAKIK